MYNIITTTVTKKCCKVAKHISLSRILHLISSHSNAINTTAQPKEYWLLRKYDDNVKENVQKKLTE